MSSYEITCVTKSARTAAGHHHILTVGISSNREIIDVAEVYKRMRAGDDFYTYGTSTWRAAVEPWHCCGLDTLRSTADAVAANNLDNLSPC